MSENRRSYPPLFFMELIKGLMLTLRMLFKKPVTIQYPKERKKVAEGFRGLHALVRDASTGKEKCIACGLCVAVCPSKCISLHTSVGPDEGRVLDRYEIEVLKCLFCALCVEACPVGAIVLTEHYEYSAYTRAELLMDKERLLANWDKYMPGEKGIDYLKKYWRPKAEDFAGHEDQPVFRRKGGGKS